ncbi:hypothetical protein [Branchiibius cervicis]|uniref:Uncharacterized protein n=1 Tax=Branchiibius cervicis TaxID=908252 RepID=A0ABW2AVD2_9MICO
MPTVTKDKAEVVAGFGKNCRDAQVGGQPVLFGLIPIEVAMSGLQENPQWLSGRLRDELRVGVSPGIWAKLDRKAMTRPN